jgi:nicotinamidase-related amidase
MSDAEQLLQENVTPADMLLELPIQFYTISQLYGPGMPSSGDEGYHTRLLEKPVGQVGLVSVHCWNLGEADGPYPINADAHCPGEPADWVPTAHEIIADKIKPVLDAARSIQMPIFHLAQYVYAPRYPQYHEIAADPALNPVEPTKGSNVIEGCLRPMTVDERWHDEYGPDFPGAVWITHADKFDIAKAVQPLPNEYVYLDGWQLNGLCRRLNIDTLIYVGFMADLCLLNIPGALREMANKFKYRCVALRDCTVAYEYPDTVEGNFMTRAAVRHVETDLGYSSSAGEFIAAAEKARTG